MKLYELPYFKRFFDETSYAPSLIGGGRFINLYVQYAQDRPDWASRLMNLLLDNAFDRNMPIDVRERCLSLAREMSGRLLQECGVMLPYAIFEMRAEMRPPRTINSGLDKLRRVMGNIHDYADDAQACFDMLENGLELVRCEECDEWEYADHATSVYRNSEYVCRSCIEDRYSWLDRYDHYVLSNDIRLAIDEDGDEVSIHYLDEDFRFDNRINQYVHVDYEVENEEEEEPPIIQPYHSSKRKQVPLADGWTKENRRWFGVELEVEYRGNGNSDDKARAINEVVNDGLYGKRAFFERDGSVPTGFEIITQPLSLPAHRELWSWLNNKKMVSDLRSHNTTTCGLHVHVSRDRMTPLQIAKIVTFVNSPTNEELIRAIARRYAEGYCRIKHKKIGSAHESEDRYEAVNLCNSKTIEFRIFKGSLKYESVVAAIEFANAMVEFTRTSGDCSIKDLNSDAFLEFINRKLASETKVLRAYINNRLETA